MRNMLPIMCGVLGLALLVSSCALVTEYNSLNAQEAGVQATWRDSQIQYDTFWKKVRETAQVPDRYKDALKDLLLSTTDARYEGKDPAFLMITEANPALDPSMYVQLQRVIEGGRNDFAATQRALVDRQRRYQTDLTSFPTVMTAGLLGFPREVLGDLRPQSDRDGDGVFSVLDYPTVTSEKTQTVFKTGRDDEALDVFGK